ncbi:MAG: DUF3135 domain-containing protein [Pseudomonadota bacterium]
MALPEFDVLVEMARHEPHKLEELRSALIRGVIDGARTPKQQKRLKGLQFRIDAERERSSSPLGATIKLSEMMCESLAQLQASIVAPEQLTQPTDNPDEIPDNVIEFPRV